MVYSINNMGTKIDKFKALFTAGIQKDKWKRFLVHDSTNLKQRSFKMVNGVSVFFNWLVWTKNAKQAFVQDNISQPVVLRRSPEFNLPLNYLLLVQQCIYGLADSVDALYHNLRQELRQVLDMDTTSGDASLYYWKDKSGLHGIIGTHVHDLFVTGSL